MVHYKLIYGNGRGAGENIRQIFAVAQVKYEDFRIDMAEWPKWKETMPFHQVPVLEVDGQRLPQSFAIARFLARKFGIAGKTAWEEAQVDAFADQWKDFLVEITTFWRTYLGFGEPGADLEKLKKEIFLPAVDKHFGLYVAALKKSKSGYLVGDSLTWADLPLAEFVSNLEEKESAIVDKFPELRAHYKKVQTNKGLAEWRKKRPITPY